MPESVEKHCRVCGKPDSEKPMAFRGEDWCSDDHRKVIQGELAPTLKEWNDMDQTLLEELGGRRCE